MGKLTGFKAYYHPPKEYIITETEQSEKRPLTQDIEYTLILQFEDEDEIWLSGCNCGYGGAGPLGTLEALRLCGLDDDRYHEVITTQKHVERDELDLDTHNFIKLRTLVYKSPALRLKENGWAPEYLITAEFNYPWQRLRALQICEAFGDIWEAGTREARDDGYTHTLFIEPEAVAFCKSPDLLEQIFRRLDGEVVVRRQVASSSELDSPM